MRRVITVALLTLTALAMMVGPALASVVNIR